MSSGSIDSILITNNTADFDRSQQTYNLNYLFAREEESLNIDLDYGTYRNENQRYQPSQYFNAAEEVELSRAINSFKTPSDINIVTFKLDYENSIFGGSIKTGVKVSG